MKLNLQMIMDHLSFPIEYIYGNTDGPMELTSIYPFISGLGSDAPGIVYIAQWDHLQDVGGYPKNLICIGGGDDARAVLTDQSRNGFVLAGSTDVLTILREIQETFTKYNSLERKLLGALLANEPIRSVLNACAMFLECHVSLYASDFALIGYSDNFQPPDDDVVWQKTLAAKRSIVPMVPREKVRMLPNNPKNFPRSTFLDVGGGVPRHLNIAFDYGDMRVATLIFCEVKKPLSEHHQWVADYIADLMHPIIMERYNTFLSTRNYFRTSVATALRYATTDSTFLHTNLARLGWNAGDDYQILLVRLPPEDRNVSHYLYNYENVFAGAYSDCVALRYEDFILILLHNGACEMLNQCLPALKKQLSMDSALCSVGLRFCDFGQMKMQFDLATLPLRISTKGRRILYYRDVMETHLINELSSCFPVRHTCHHAAIRVQEYDAANGTDFLLTLETYLMNNKSLMTASEKLFIHRSTLTYRLKSIEKIAPMQLDDPSERLHILLSCIALRIVNKNVTSASQPKYMEKNRDPHIQTDYPKNHVDS